MNTIVTLEALDALSLQIKQLQSDVLTLQNVTQANTTELDAVELEKMYLAQEGLTDNEVWWWCMTHLSKSVLTNDTKTAKYRKIGMKANKTTAILASNHASHFSVADMKTEPKQVARIIEVREQYGAFGKP